MFKHIFRLILIFVLILPEPCALIGQTHSFFAASLENITRIGPGGSATYTGNVNQVSYDGITFAEGKSGDLKFYISGNYVFNRWGQLFDSSEVLKSSGEEIGSIPVPGDSTKYYIFHHEFTSQNSTKLLYSVIDMTENNGLGGFHSVNTFLTSLNTRTTSLEIIKRPCSDSYWLVYFDPSSGYSRLTIDSNGIHSQTLVLPVSSIPNFSAYWLWQGVTEIDYHKGKLVSAIGWGFGPVGAHIVDFDVYTGSISHLKNLIIKPNSFTSLNNGLYGADFSPDGTKIYATYNLLLYQYDIIGDSLRQVDGYYPPYVCCCSSQVERFGNVELAPDNQVYVSAGCALLRIVDPNSNYPTYENTQYDYYFSYKLSDHNQSIIRENNLKFDIRVCDPDTAVLSAPAFLNPVSGHQWYSDSNPGVVFSNSPTTVVSSSANIKNYTLKGFYNSCPITVNFTIESSVSPNVTIGKSNDSLCSGQNVMLNAVGGSLGSFKHKWTPETYGDYYNSSVLNVTPPVSQWYFHQLSSEGGCISMLDSIYVNVVETGIRSVNIEPAGLCLGDSTELKVNVKKYLFFDSFSNGIDTSIWYTSMFGAITTACGSLAGPAYQASASVQSVSTKNLSIPSGGKIGFAIKISGPDDCDDVDPGRDVVLEYSVNQGTSWQLIEEYRENNHPVFKSYEVDIPENAQTTATRFRWKMKGSAHPFGPQIQDIWLLDNVYVTVNDTAGFHFKWFPSSSLSSDTIFNPIAFPTTTSTYSITAFPGDSSCMYTDTMTMKVGPAFTFSLPADTMLCQENATIPLQPTSALQGTHIYTWGPAGESGTSDTVYPSVSPTVTTNYVVSVEKSGCVNSDTIQIGIGGPLSLTVQTDKFVACAGDSVKLTAIISKPCHSTFDVCNAPDTSYTPFPGTISSNYSVSPYSAYARKSEVIFTKKELNVMGIIGPSLIDKIAFYSNNTSSPGSWINFQVRMGCISDSIASSIFKEPTDTVLFPQTLAIQPGWFFIDLDKRYYWDGESTLLIHFRNSSSTLSGTANIYYQETNSNSVTTYNVGNLSFPYGIASRYRPVMALSSCSQPVPTGSSLTWQPTSSLTNTSQNQVMAAPISPSGNFQVQAFDTLSGCYLNGNITVPVSPGFSLTLADTLVNCNSNGVYSYATVSPSSSYLYSWEPTAFVEDASSPATSFSPPTSSIYHITVTDSSGCSKTDSIYILAQKPYLDLRITANRESVCLGDTISLQGEINPVCGSSEITCSSPNQTYQCGTGTLSLLSGPFGHFPNKRIQVILTKQELLASGMSAGKALSEIGFNVVAISGAGSYPNFSMRIGFTNVNFTGNVFQPTSRTVFTPKTVNLSIGVNMFSLDSVFYWDGESHIILETCYYGSGSVGSQNATVTGANIGQTIYYQASNPCNVASGVISNSKLNVYFTACDANSNHQFTYHWNPGNGIPTDTTLITTFYPGSSGYVSLHTTDQTTGCLLTDSIFIEVRVPSNILQLGNDTLICDSPSHLLDGGPGFTSYLWDDGTTGRFRNVFQSGIYYVTATDSCGTATDTIQVNFGVSPTVSFPTSPAICPGDTLTLFVGTNGNAIWQDGSTSSVYQVTSPGYYSVTFSNSCGTTTDSVTVIQNSPPVFNLGSDTLLCPQVFTLFPGVQGTLIWNNGTTGPVLPVSSGGTYSLSVSNTCGTFTDSITILYKTMPWADAGNDTSICNSTLITGTGNADTFSWSNGSNGLSTTVSTSGVYTLAGINSCGTFIDTITILLKPIPWVDAGNDTSICNSTLITGTGNADTFTWSNGSNGLYTTVSTGGVYTLTGNNICGTFIDTITILLKPMPWVNAGNDTSICNATLITGTGSADTFIWNNGSNGLSTTISASGVYTLTGINSCGISVDSLIATNNAVNASVLQTGLTLAADSAGVQYQWIDCNSNFDIIPGETNQTFTPATAGNYAVIISKGNCSDTSNCYTVSVGISAVKPASGVMVIPNPTSGAISIQFPEIQPEVLITVSTVTGQVILTEKFVANNRFELFLPGAPGIYFIEMITPEWNIYRESVIKN